MNTYNGTSAHLTAYTYKVYDTLGNFITWWPTDPGQVSAEYSLLLHSNTAGVGELVSKSSIRLFPNPGTHFHTLELDGLYQERVNVDLYSIDGRFIRNCYSGSPEQQKISLSFDISSLPPGMYLYSIAKDSGNEVIRFTKR